MIHIALNEKAKTKLKAVNPKVHADVVLALLQLRKNAKEQKRLKASFEEVFFVEVGNYTILYFFFCRDKVMIFDVLG